MLKGSAALPVSWLLSGEGERSGFRVSIRAEVILPTHVGRCGWMRCPAAHCSVRVFEWRQGAVRRGDDKGCPGYAHQEFLACDSLQSKTACAASPLAAAALGEATHTSRAALRLGTAAVVKRSAGLDCDAVSARVCQFHAADHGVNARIMPPRGFGGAASFSV